MEQNVQLLIIERTTPKQQSDIVIEERSQIIARPDVVPRRRVPVRRLPAIGMQFIR